MIEEIAGLPEGTLGFKISGNVTGHDIAYQSASQLWAIKPGRKWLEKSWTSS
jgi:hypothetical protein